MVLDVAAGNDSAGGGLVCTTMSRQRSTHPANSRIFRSGVKTRMRTTSRGNRQFAGSPVSRAAQNRRYASSGSDWASCRYSLLSPGGTDTNHFTFDNASTLGTSATHFATTTPPRDGTTAGLLHRGCLSNAMRGWSCQVPTRIPAPQTTAVHSPRRDSFRGIGRGDGNGIHDCEIGCFVRCRTKNWWATLADPRFAPEDAASRCCTGAARRVATRCGTLCRTAEFPLFVSG